MRYYPWIMRRNDPVKPVGQPGTGGLQALFPKQRGGTGADALPAQIEVGAQVGVKRNLEFSAGGRAHRLSAGSYTKA